MTTTSRGCGPVAVRPTAGSTISPSSLALEKVIQDHIPSVSLHLRHLLALLEPSSTTAASASRRSLSLFERDLRRLCHQAQDGVRRMDSELRTIEAGWDVVDKARWDICRRDYKGVMKLVQMVWEAGQGRMDDLRELRFADAAGRTKSSVRTTARDAGMT
jgi:hypothetical protein